MYVYIQMYRSHFNFFKLILYFIMEATITMKNAHSAALSFLATPSLRVYASVPYIPADAFVFLSVKMKIFSVKV